MKGAPDTRLGVIGAGFWSRFQVSAWKELEGVECAAICDRNRARAEVLARDLGIAAVHDDPEQMLRAEKLDLVAVITDPPGHAAMVRLAAATTWRRSGSSSPRTTRRGPARASG